MVSDHGGRAGAGVDDIWSGVVYSDTCLLRNCASMEVVMCCPPQARWR